MALEDFIVDITGKVVQNIEEIQHLFKVDKFNKIKNLVRELKFYTQLNTQANQLMDELL
jgi:molecular chaperone HscB